MKSRVNILAMFDKKGKNGNSYKSFKTDQGTINIFDEELATVLRENLGNMCEVELVPNGQYKNITAFYQKIEGASVPSSNQTNWKERNAETDRLACVNSAIEAFKLLYEMKKANSSSIPEVVDDTVLFEAIKVRAEDLYGYISSEGDISPSSQA